jgi:3-deoxy-D-arabino-heptulosonate 7-phosphate (DAHP) synthase
MNWMTASFKTVDAIKATQQPLIYGQSITGGCIDRDANVGGADALAGAVRTRRVVRAG